MTRYAPPVPEKYKIAPAERKALLRSLRNIFRQGDERESMQVLRKRRIKDEDPRFAEIVRHNNSNQRPRGAVPEPRPLSVQDSVSTRPGLARSRIVLHNRAPISSCSTSAAGRSAPVPIEDRNFGGGIPGGKFTV